MNLYLISQDQNRDYDTYSAAVVAAPNDEEARQMHPNGKWNDSTWTNDPNRVKVELLGKAIWGTKKGVILSDFRAG